MNSHVWMIRDFATVSAVVSITGLGLMAVMPDDSPVTPKYKYNSRDLK